MIVEDDEIISNSIAGYLQKMAVCYTWGCGFSKCSQGICGTITGSSINGY